MLQHMAGSETSGEADFGYRRVKAEEKARLVRHVFESVADRYDLMNDLMSGGVHRLWKAELIDRLAPRAGQRVLDVAGGTGDIAERVLGRAGDARVVVCDVTEAMLRRGRDRAIDAGRLVGVLKPGGRFLCLEFSRVEAPLLGRVYDLYSFAVLPLLGQVVAGDRDSYQYLVESIRRFPPQAELARMMEEAGLEQVSYRNLTGGIAALHSGWRL
jgi:demethylmenaquinone methyltransferase/2-methoxy-6-polyprenyl-1,4-benzoquinol methylase